MKKRFHKQEILSGFGFIVRLILGCVFLAGALPKIHQPYDFLGDVYGYEIVGPKLGILVAMTMPWAELVVGICLLGSIFVGGALLVSFCMGAMFTFVLSWAIYHGLDISCGCFGSGSHQIGYLTLIRAVLITVFSCIAFVLVLFRQNENAVQVAAE